jgi:molecular chaperone Hsp33
MEEGSPTPETRAARGDHVLRAITDDDNFRVITADTTDTVRQALATQGADGATARHFADLLTGTVLIRETMSPGHRVQGVLKGAGGRGSLVADTHPDGITRGLVQLPKGTEQFEIGSGSVLQMMRSMARGIHRSVVEPRPGGTVPEALMTYMQVSEQIASVIVTGAEWEDTGGLAHAGGFVVQLLPGASRGPLSAMIERLERMPAFDDTLRALDGSPRKLMAELLRDVPYAQLDDRPVTFGCKCSEEAVVASLASLPRDDLAELLREREVIELSCDYCKTDYPVRRAQLAGLLDAS